MTPSLHSPNRHLAPACRVRPQRALLLVLFASGIATAQTTAAPAATPGSTPAAAAGPLASLSWLEGCWQGEVNQREFTEQWMPGRPGAMQGTSRMVMTGKSQGEEKLRLESRADGIYYVVAPEGEKEQAFQFIGMTVDTIEGRGDDIFTFENPAQEFPHRIVYRHTAGGGLFAQVEGKVNGADRKIIYPMHKVDCRTGKEPGRP
jgi:hypothetical protein